MTGAAAPTQQAWPKDPPCDTSDGDAVDTSAEAPAATPLTEAPAPVPRDNASGPGSQLAEEAEASASRTLPSSVAAARGDEDVDSNPGSESAMPFADEGFLGPDLRAEQAGSDSLDELLSSNRSGSDLDMPDSPSDDEEQPAPFAAGFPGMRASRPAAEYPVAAAGDFRERFAHRLRWAHAVNSRRKLRIAMAAPVHFIEADVSIGPLTAIEKPQHAGTAGLEQQHRKGSDADKEAARMERRRRRLKRAAEAAAAAPGDDKPLSTTVRATSGEAVIMAHYPTELSSDLSLEDLIQAVIRHNERIAEMEVIEAEASQGSAVTNGATSARQDGSIGEAFLGSSQPSRPSRPSRPALASPFSVPITESPTTAQVGPRAQPGGPPACEEAAGFARELDRELEVQAKSQPGMLAVCVGSRRDGRRKEIASLTRKGVKLDFKRREAVEPTLRYLREVGAARKLGGHLWLNADVFAGPGALLTPLDAKQFTELCAEALPEAVLSLSWGSSIISTTRTYTDEMVESMLKLVMSPIVPRMFPASSSLPKRTSSDNSAGIGSANVAVAELSADPHVSRDLSRESASNFLSPPSASPVYLTPAAVCRHITFAVAAEYALNSAVGLKRLLDAVPGSSLTIFCGVGSLGITPATVQAIIATYGKGRVFLDLKLSKAWRSCSGASCGIQ